MSIIDSILTHNKRFVENKEYESLQTTKFPDKKMVILTCMDTRLIELLPKAMNIGNGDAKILKNAGAMISHPFGSIMRSILVALYELRAQEVFVVGHYGCGMAGLKADSIMEKAKENGVSEDNLRLMEYAGIDVNTWLRGFEDEIENVKHSVNIIREHPLLPEGTPVHGLIISPETGQLDLIDKG